MQHEKVDDGLVGVGQGDLIKCVGDADVAILKGLPDPIYALAGRECLVTDLRETGEALEVTGRKKSRRVS